MAFNTFGGGTDGAQVTTATTFPVSGDPLGAVSSTLTHSAAHALHGPYAALTTSTAASAVVTPPIWTSEVAARIYVKCVSTVPTVDMHVIRVHSAGVRYASVHINSAGALRLSDATGTTGVWTATNALTPDVWYRVEMLAISGSTTSNGTLSIAYYEGDSTTPIQTWTSTTANAGANIVYDYLALGKYSATTQQLALSAPGWVQGATGLMGPHTGGAWYVGAGVVSYGTAGLTVALPAAATTGDLLLMAAESANQTIATPTGWTPLAQEGTGTAAAVGAVCVGLFWRWYAAGSVTVADSGDHTVAQIVALRGVHPTTPLGTALSRVDSSATTTLTTPSITVSNSNTASWVETISRT